MTAHPHANLVQYFHVLLALLDFAVNVYQVHIYFGVCPSCIPSCRTCSSQSTCEVCNKGFYLQADEKACISCAENCEQCTAANACMKCKSGYFDTDGICFPCNKNCKSCENDNICTECFEGFYLHNNTCHMAVSDIFPSNAVGLAGSVCHPSIYTGTMKVGAESGLTNVSIQVPSEAIGGYAGNIIVNFPKGFATEMLQ